MACITLFLGQGWAMSELSWYEVWADEGIYPPYVLLYVDVAERHWRSTIP